ncbi:MAG: PhzF family phenazine biosynthesis protein [Defluviitaleaceae bacterium]|nr:PhzF family phenazine biosynthesis protein [Defluviitaleaceae bacterium]
MEYHVIDVFTDKLFGGNPAGVCLMEKLDGRESWLPDSILQNIAAENNLSETAFLLKQEDGSYRLRWFTPAIEVDLCGHATMASAFVLFNGAEKPAREINFHTMSGLLTVRRCPEITKQGDLLEMNLPAMPVVECPMYSVIESALGVRPVAVYKGIDFLVLLDDEETLLRVAPDFTALKRLKEEAGLNHDMFGVIITATGSDCDFVSRYFAPNAGIDEDPVTGRAHCALTPFWSEKLNKKVMSAKQLSTRGGILHCEDCGDRVKLSGNAIRYLQGHIEL